MDDRAVRAALERHWAASDASDFEIEHDIYRDDAMLDYPQSGERIRGRRNIQASRAAQPNAKRFTVRRILGAGSSNALLRGSAAVVASPETSKGLPPQKQRGFSSPTSGS